MDAFPTLRSYWNYLQQEHFPGQDPTPFPMPRDKYTLKLFSVAEWDLKKARFTNAFIAQSGMEDLLWNLPNWEQVEETLNILHEELDNA